MSTAPPLVALTGGIGAGKSEALKALERLGAATLSSDAVVHELYADREVVAAVVGRWGDEVAPGGVVDRSVVARRAFGGDATEREWLEGQIWPRVGARVGAWIEQQRALSPPPPVLVIEVPLLFEPFRRAGTARTARTGAGLGLAIVRAVAQVHGGTATATARPSGGLVVTVDLPRSA